MNTDFSQKTAELKLNCLQKYTVHQVIIYILDLKCKDKKCANNAGCYLNNNNEAVCQCTPDWMGDLCDKPVPKATGLAGK